MIVSVIRPALESFQPLAEGSVLNGASLADARSLRALANADGIEALEIFLPLREMLPIERLAACAHAILEPRHRGQGRLRFHALHNLPSVWEDAAPRVIYTQDLYLLSRDRYLRDRYARGPMAVISDVHCLGHRDIWNAFREIANLEPVAHDRIVATSRSIDRGIQASFAALGKPTPATKIWPRSIDLDVFCPTGEEGKRLARRALGLPASATIALYLSRLTPNDKADLLPLIDAFAMVAGKDDLLLLAGVENVAGYAKALRQRGAELGVNVEVRTEVPRGTQPLYFAAADLFVFPGDTVQEANPTTVAEAAACGLPVVATDWDGIRDVVVPGETGLLVPTSLVMPPEELEGLFPASDFLTDFLVMGQSVVVDHAALAEALGKLLRNPQMRAEMGAAARQFAERHLAVNAWIEEVVRLGKELLAIASAEPPANTLRRRQAAETSHTAMPFGQIFAGYASQTVQDADLLRLTEKGQRALQGHASPAFYDACLPYLNPVVVPVLLQAVASIGKVGSSITRASDEAKVPIGRARFALALLLKHGYVQLEHV